MLPVDLRDQRVLIQERGQEFYLHVFVVSKPSKVPNGFKSLGSQLFCPVQKVSDGWMLFFSVRLLLFQDCFMVPLYLRDANLHICTVLFPEVSEVGSSSGRKALPPTLRSLAIWPFLSTKKFYQGAGGSPRADTI